MHLNLVQFSDLPNLDILLGRLGDEIAIVAQDFSAQQLKEFSEQTQNTKTKFYSCKLISKLDNSELQKSKLANFSAIYANSIENCSFAANQKLDLVLNPFNSEKNFLDAQTANVFAQNNTFIGIVFADFLRAQGFARSQLLKNASMALRVAQNSGAKILFSSRAQNIGELRASKDLSSFAVLLGMKTEAAIRATKINPQEFLERLK